MSFTWKEEYTSTAIPKKLKERINNIIKSRKELGYRSVNEFVLDAIRRRLEEIEKIH